MSTYGNTPQNQGRQRRVERYAGEFLSEPSMSAPQPIPGTKAQAAQTPAHTYPTAPVHPEYAAVPVGQPYAQQQVDQHGWSQPYAAQQPGTTAGWQQPYAAQPGEPAGWSQQYAQPGAQGGWSQQYAPQPVQPYAAQPDVPQGQAAAPQGWPGNGYVPPSPPGNAGNGNAASSSGSGGGTGGNNWWIMAIVAVLLVTLTPILVNSVRLIDQSNVVHTEVTAYNDRFCEGVYVDGIHLGGMTQQEAIAAVEASAQERMASWTINLTYGGQLVRQITAEDLGMTINVHDALEAAWEQGHASSDVVARKEAMDALQQNPYHGYTAVPSGDTTAIDQILNDLAAPVYRAPVDATVTFISDAHAYPFEYTPEVYGQYLDVDSIKSEMFSLVENMESGSIELVLKPIAPSVTEADLRRTRTLRGSATTQISSMSTDERTANIQRAFQLINGTVIKPGESFSFNGVVGARSSKNGFQLAIEYAYGNERLGYGGGVCQASTTIYLAAQRADMTITHREPHSDKVNYTEYGLDATVNYDGKKIDLTFQNTTACDVYVMAYLVRMNNRWTCKVDIYGEALPEGVTYDLIAETVEVLPAPTDPEYVEDKTGEKVLYIDDKPVQKRPASDGYVVETFRVKYVNGEEVDRTFVARDTYKAKSQQLWVGIKERDD